MSLDRVSIASGYTCSFLPSDGFGTAVLLGVLPHATANYDLQ